MKPALNQQAIRTTNGTQNWTDASIVSDQTLQLFFGTEALTNNPVPATAVGKMFLGASDLTNNIAFCFDSLDNTAANTANATSMLSSTACLVRTTSTGTKTVAAAVSAILSNGITLNFTTTDATAYLFNALSLAGSDHVVNISTTQFATTDTSKVVTHGDSSAPDAVIMFVSVGSTGTDIAAFPQRTIVGFYDGTNSVSSSYKVSSQTDTPTHLAARMTNDFGHQINASDSDVATFSIGSVGATTFTLTRTATDTTAAFVTCISIRHTSGTWAAKCGVTTLPTSAPPVIAALVTGMAAQPQVLITMASRLTSTVLAANSDAAGSTSFGVACNNAGTTQQMAVALTNKSGVATTVAKCYTSNNQALLSLDNTGAVVNAATVNSWDSGGVTLNHSAVGASAFEVMYLAFGITTPAVVGNRPLGGLPRTQMHWRQSGGTT